MWELDHKKAEHQKIDAFQWRWWRRLLRVPWTAWRFNQSILKKATLNIYWKDCHWSWNSNNMDTWCKNWLTGRDPDAGKVWRQEEKGMTEDEMVARHHWLNGDEFEQAPGVGGGQGSLLCCSPWGRKESDMSEWLNWLMALLYLPCVTLVKSI